MTPLSHYHVSVETMEQELQAIEASKKDPDAFRPLYEKYHEPIFRYVYQRSDDKEAAFDITQQVFIKALVNIQRYTFKGVPFSSWLYRIAKSEVYQAIQNYKVNRTLNIDIEGLKELLHDAEADESLIQKEKSLTRCMGQLHEADLQLIEMRFFERRAFKEIGHILEMTENNAKVKVYRILDKLKKCILANI
jgi:RNA polymerase sigma-70 factor (ECF subfamily)